MKSLKRIALPVAALWRVALVVALIACVLPLANLWLKAGKDTEDAFLSGRRLMVRIDNSEIEGKIIAGPEDTKAVKEPAASESKDTKESKEEPAAEPAAAAAAASQTAAVTATASATETAATGTAVVEKVEVNELLKPSDHPPQGVNNALIEKTDYGYLPIVGRDGTKPWRFYAKPFVYKGAVPMIVIVVTGLGQSKAATEAALRLPENTTLSFSPYAHDVESWVASARQAGHEIMLDLPMEPTNYPANDPGPLALISSKAPKELESKIDGIMGRAGGYVGFVTEQSESFSAHEEPFKWLVGTLNTRGLLLVLGREPAQNSTRDMVNAKNNAAVISDIWIDEELSVMTIQARLGSLEQLALKRGYSIGIARAYPETIEQIKLWSDRLADKGVMLVPVSAVVRMKIS